MSKVFSEEVVYAPLIHSVWNIFEVGTVLVLFFLRGKSQLTSTIGLLGWGGGLLMDPCTV